MFKIGDKVRVKACTVGESYGGVTFLPSMAYEIGKVYTIEGVTDQGDYNLYGFAYIMSEKMLEPVDEPVGDKHTSVCKELHNLYLKKNHDYGDSFHKSYEEEGLAMVRIRLGDKFNRFKTLSKSERQVEDESIRDTLIDLANYAILAVMEIDGGRA